MEKRNYAVMLLFVFAVVDVYSYPGELDTRPDFSPEEFYRFQQNEANLHGVASESDEENLHADGLRRTKRNNNAHGHTKGQQPAFTTESPAAVSARLAAERERERRRLVTEYQKSIESYMKRGYKRSAAIELAINENLTKAYRIVELSVFPHN